MLISMLSIVLPVSMVLIQRAAADADLYRDAAPAEAEGYDWR